MFGWRVPGAGRIALALLLAAAILTVSALVIGGNVVWSLHLSSTPSAGSDPQTSQPPGGSDQAGSQAPATAPEMQPPAAEPMPNGNAFAFDGMRPKPNELGRIMVLEYHQFGPQEDRWTRSYANFRKDLERLYRRGYRPIGLNDYIANHIDVPAGTTPIIFTFDDSSPGQFRYVPGPDGRPTIDPDSAVGIILAFNHDHPDWRLRGTFFVLAGVVPAHRLFGQVEYASQKIQELVDLGFELGNHTYWHMQLSKLDKAGVNKQLGIAVRAIQEIVPGYTVNSLALPLGSHPSDRSWAVDGSYEGTTYHNRAILEVSGGAAYSPSNRKANALALPRIQATQLEWDFYTNFLDYYDHHPEERYTSDGDPDRVVFPAAMAQDYRGAATDRPLPDPADGYHAVGLR